MFNEQVLTDIGVQVRLLGEQSVRGRAKPGLNSARHRCYRVGLALWTGFTGRSR